jgi:hypothetical protein
MTKKNTKREPDSPPLDLTTKHGVSHWTRIVGHYMLTLANDVPRLDALELMSSQQRSNLAGDLIGNTIYALRQYRWDKALRWLRDSAPRGLVCDLEDKYSAIPWLDDFQYVFDVTAQMEPGKTYVTESSGKKLPDTVSELVHLGEMLRVFGQALVEISTTLGNGAKVASDNTQTSEYVTIRASNEIKLPIRGQPMGAKELGEIFNCSARTVLRRIKDGTLDAERHGAKYRILVAQLPAEYVQRVIAKK